MSASCTPQDAVVKGWFRTSRLPTQGGTALRVAALTGYEIASALAYIHAHNTLHLDLSGGNVLLTSCAVNPHGFAAKVRMLCMLRGRGMAAAVTSAAMLAASHEPPCCCCCLAQVADFGLARNMDVRARTAPGCYGTVTHMAPETITQGLLSAACDVYAWGVLLWEMLTGSRAWAGMTHAEVLAAVGSGRQQLWVPPGLPPVLRELLVGCLARQPEDRCGRAGGVAISRQRVAAASLTAVTCAHARLAALRCRRPTFKQVLPRLEQYLQATRGTQPELPLRSTAARDY